MRAEIDRIKSQIEEIESLLINWRSKHTNSKPMIKVKKAAKADIWIWHGYIWIDS
jgi:hypothetical protein